MCTIQVNAFFGPVCDYALAPVARYSPIWHTPVLTTGALSFDFGVNKNWEYPLLTRVGATLDSMSRCIEGTMLHFNWNKIKVSLNHEIRLVLENRLTSLH